ncbi:ceramide synthase LOH2-like [Aristolochia californica]|uniref:ceramide synthase LOH2-like n=1 Tax=Aristolochia californica TaxID=171875 RepID=UPI0035D6A8F5
MDSIWSRTVVPQTWHVGMTIGFAFFFLAARLLLDHFIYQRIAARLLNKGTGKVSKAKRAKIVKCAESMWKFTYYAVIQCCILKITYREPWFRDTKEYFRGWPNQELKVPLQLFYMCQCGFYIYSIGALLTWETRRKDFSIMMSHHIITVILIGYSYISRFFRIGSIVLALHDTSDVFMEAAKVFKYSERELAASVLFGLFAISWLILRLIFFPFWVIWAVSFEFGDFLDLSDGAVIVLYYAYNTMLLKLLVFHIYWFKLICAMILRQLKNKGKVGEDIRSDSEGED